MSKQIGPIRKASPDGSPKSSMPFLALWFAVPLVLVLMLARLDLPGLVGKWLRALGL